MSRRLIGRIVNGEYVNLEHLDEVPSAMRPPRYGEGSDYFKGVRPSQLSQLDTPQLFEAAERMHLTLSEGRGTEREISGARDAYDTVMREARSRRTTLHG